MQETLSGLLAALKTAYPNVPVFTEAPRGGKASSFFQVKEEPEAFIPEIGVRCRLEQSFRVTLFLAQPDLMQAKREERRLLRCLQRLPCGVRAQTITVYCTEKAVELSLGYKRLGFLLEDAPEKMMTKAVKLTVREDADGGK